MFPAGRSDGGQGLHGDSDAGAEPSAVIHQTEYNTSDEAYQRSVSHCSGRAPKVIQSRLGHASIKITLDLRPPVRRLDEAAADRIDEAWRASLADARLTRPQSELIQLPKR